MNDDLQSREAALSQAWIGEAFARRKLSEFGEVGIEWGKRVQGKGGAKLGLRSGLYAYCPSRDFALLLAGAIAVHGKATVKHVPLPLLADMLDSPFDYESLVSEVAQCGLLVVSMFFKHETEKVEVFPARSRWRVEHLLQKRMDHRQSILLSGDILRPSLPWWQASFVDTVNKRFEMINA